MTDTTLCIQDDCPIRMDCFRYLHLIRTLNKEDKIRGLFKPDFGDHGCDYFMADYGDDDQHDNESHS